MDLLEEQLAGILSRNWWLVLLRGLIAIGFGILVWIQPEISLRMLIMLFAVFSLTDGVLEIGIAIAGRDWLEQKWVLIIRGLLGIGLGILTILRPDVTAMALLFYISIWAIAGGVLDIVTGIRLRKEMTGEWLLILGGIMTVAFGALLIAWPSEGALAVLWLIGTYATIFGALLIGLAFRMRSFGKRLSGSDKK